MVPIYLIERYRIHVSYYNSSLLVFWTYSWLVDSIVVVAVVVFRNTYLPSSLRRTGMTIFPSCDWPCAVSRLSKLLKRHTRKGWHGSYSQIHHRSLSGNKLTTRDPVVAEDGAVVVAVVRILVVVLLLRITMLPTHQQTLLRLWTTIRLSMGMKFQRLYSNGRHNILLEGLRLLPQHHCSGTVGQHQHNGVVLMDNNRVGKKQNKPGWRRISVLQYYLTETK